MVFPTAAEPVNSKYKYIMNFFCLLTLELEMTEGGGSIQRRSINVITVKPEIKADRICREFCRALNYINAVICSLSLEVLKLGYTQSAKETKQIQDWSLLLCPFQLSFRQTDISSLWKRYQTGTLWSWWSTGRLCSAATSMTWILASTKFYSLRSLAESTYMLK